MSMLLDVPAAHASCSGAGGRMANAQACSCTARSDATWASHSTRPGPSRVVAIPARLPASGAPSDVFILDFDGVLVDSEPEVSMAGFRAANKLWTGNVTDAEKDQVLEGLRVTRPVLISGWETVVMARIFAEDADAAPKILHDWPALMDASLKAWGTNVGELRRIFEEERNAWMDGEEAEWLGLVQPWAAWFPHSDIQRWRRSHGMIWGLFTHVQLPFYIASSKAPHRVSRVAEKQLGLDLPVDSPRLFAGLIPPTERKTEALREIAERPLVSEGGARMHFIDDRLETVRGIASDAALREAGLRVYFAEWGYSTPQEKLEAQQLDNVTSITLPQMIELVKWGILMGVDDGCGDDN